MKILQVLLSERIGGAESAARTLAAEWQATGHESATVYLDAEGSNPIDRLRHLRGAIRDSQSDVVLSHSALPNAYARTAAVGLAIPVICVLHSAARDFDDVKIRAAETLLQSRTGAVVAVSASQVTEYRARFPRTPVDLIPNGVGEEFFPAVEVPHDFKILSVGRVVQQKDPRTWAQIASRMRMEDIRLQFEWVGPTGMDRTLSPLEDGLFETNGVRFVGPSVEVAANLRSARLFLHTAHREAHSVALLEAAASGLPIVCTHEVGAGLPEWIVREEFVSGDEESGLRAVRCVVSSIADYESRSRAVAAQVVREFGVGACAEKYIQVFERLR